MKKFQQYTNVLDQMFGKKWQDVAGSGGLISQLNLSIQDNGDYVRLTKFKSGADTSSMGETSHNYPEEIYVISGKFFDGSVKKWLKSGDYVNRPINQKHGPFLCEEETLVLEISHISQTDHNL
jgi:hypothetical protein